MPSSPHEFLTLSLELLKSSSLQTGGIAEASRRTAISRAYYAAYHLGQELHAHFGISATPSSSPEGMHKSLIANLKACSIKIKPELRGHWRSLIEDVDNLRKRRVKADYRLNEVVEESFAKASVDLAARTIKKLREYLSPDVALTVS